MSGGESGEGVREPGLGIDGVELAGLAEAGDDRPVVAAVVGAGEQGVLAVERERPDRAFDGVAVELDEAVVEETDEAIPAGKRLADRVGEHALAAGLRQLGRGTAAGRR